MWQGVQPMARTPTATHGTDEALDWQCWLRTAAQNLQFNFLYGGFLLKVPLLVTAAPPEFGELKLSPEFHDESRMNRDLTYVPGFSELRLARDNALLEVRQGKRQMRDVPTMPYNCRWVRAQNKKGETDNRKIISAGNRGYKPITKDQVGEGKLLPSLPPGAHFDASGAIMQGDTQLMITSAENAARNEFRKRARTEAATRGVEAGFATALKEVGGRPSPGAAPFIQKEVGHRVQAELSPKPKTESK